MDRKRELLGKFLNRELSYQELQLEFTKPISPIGIQLSNGKVQINTLAGKREVDKDKIEVPEDIGVFVINDIKPADHKE